MFYTYFCKKCGMEKEEMHGMLEKPKVKCPVCKSAMKIRVTGGAGVHYKARGFYGNKTIDQPPTQHYKVHELVGEPHILKNCLRK
jgi:putative FmdB family regulatory protein